DLRLLASRLRAEAAAVESEIQPFPSLLENLNVSGQIATHLQNTRSQIRSSTSELVAALSEAAQMVEELASTLDRANASVASSLGASVGDLKLILEATGATVAVGGLYLRAKVLEMARRAQERGADVEINLRAGTVRIWNQPRQEAEELQRQLVDEQ